MPPSVPRNFRIEVMPDGRKRYIRKIANAPPVVLDLAKLEQRKARTEAHKKTKNKQR